MNEWGGLERVMRLSLSLEIGAQGLALLVALEYKKSLQKEFNVDGEGIRLSAEEWRAAAGIFDRKAYDRARKKLEELNIIGVHREGRILKVTLWPELHSDLETLDNEEKVSYVPMNEPYLGIPNERINERPEETPSGTVNETDEKTQCETSHGVSSGTSPGAPYGTPSGTSPGTSHGTALTPIREPSGIASPHTPTYSDSPSITNPGRSTEYSKDKTLTRYSLYRNSLSRYSLQKDRSSISLIINNNEKRNNELRKKDNEILSIQEPKIRKSTKPTKPTKPTKSEIGENFRQLWLKEMGQPLTPYQEEGLMLFVRLGYAEEIFIEALRYAVMADHRHMGYVLGILRNWHNQNVREKEDIPRVQQDWEDKRFLKRKFG